MRRVVLATALGLLGLILLASPAAADQRSGTDPEGDVPYRRGDIVSWRAIHASTVVDLRVRTARAANPLDSWPNLATRIRWRIDTAPAPGPEYLADLYIAAGGFGVDRVFLGSVVRLQDDQVTCHSSSFVSNDGNLYRIWFPRGCIDASSPIRVRATFIWDHGPAGGPVHTDYAPDGGPTTPIVTA